eukprot:scaffold23479_cov143-Cylindrotheca_fusiformis.AAC.8
MMQEELPAPPAAEASTTATAEPEPPGTPPATTATATTSESSPPTIIERGHRLLREWHSGNGPEESGGSNSNMSSPPPVVAPAVVLNETSEDSNTTPTRGGVYPVATFVSNLVRTSVNEIRSHIPITTSEDSAVVEGSDLSATIRSLNAIRDNGSGSQPQQPRRSSMADMGDQEYVLIDGDLVAIPSHHHHDPSSLSEHNRRHHHTQSETNLHQYYGYDDQQSILTDSSFGEGYSFRQDGQNRRFQNNSCRQHNNKMKRGVKGIKKWIKRKGRRATKAHARDELYESSTHPSLASATNPSSRQLIISDDDDSAVVPTSLSVHSSSSLRRASLNAANPSATASAATTTTVNVVPDDHSIASSVNAMSAAESSITTSTAATPASSPNRLRKQDKKLKKKNKLEKKMEKKLKKQEKQQLKQKSVLNRKNQTLPSLESVMTGSAPGAAAAAAPPPVASMPPSYSLEPPSAATAATGTVARMSPLSSLHGGHSQSPMEASASTASFQRVASIAAEASFVGNADQLAADVVGVVPCMAAEAYIEDRLDDYDKYYDDEDKKKMEAYPPSLVPKDADFKVDKLEAPNVESMLQRAGEFARDLESSVLESFWTKTPRRGRTKSEAETSTVPLSMATLEDVSGIVHNDILKVVMVGAETVDKLGLERSLRNKSQKKKAASRKRTNTLGVDVHSWTPPNDQGAKFTIWNVQGNCHSDAFDPYSSNFGAHPGTQSLFFSDRSLYLLVWDLATNNPKTIRRQVSPDTSDSSSSEDEGDVMDSDNDYLREEANRQADRALQTDIEERVLSWVDCIARQGSHSAVLPIALVPSSMSPVEAKRRCDIMQTLLMEHTEKKLEGRYVPPKVLVGAETILCVSLDTNMGMDLLEQTIVAIATDANHSVFDHVGTPVPPGTVQVMETTRRLKEADHKLVSLDLFMSELPSEIILSVGEVMNALEFLSCIGELFYFGSGVDTGAAAFDVDNIQSQYIILSRKWLVSALSCVLRNDLKRELNETRRFMNMQCLYSNQQFPENHAIQTLSAGSSSCPLLSSSDTEMLWQSMSFMREAADKSSQLSELSTTCSTMFGYLETLLVHTGVFLPLDIDRIAVPDCVYFVPSLLAKGDSASVWTFKSSDAYMTTLSHSWLFRDGAPIGLMEHVTVALLRDLYEFSHIVASSPFGDTKPAGQNTSPPSRAQTFPLGQDSLQDFIGRHDGDAIGQIRIHQINCWKSSLLVKIGCVFPEGSEIRESFVEIFVSISDPSSTHCVASDAMGSNMQRLIVSGKGHVGHHGRKLWKGGYGIVLDSIKASVAHCTNVDRQVVCPECLAHAHPSSASTWSWDSVRAAAGSRSSVVRCMRGHRVDSNLICGIPKLVTEVTSHHTGEMPKKSVTELLPSVVVVGLWDADKNAIQNVGSGFIADKKLGLVITAGHILFSMEEGPNFGTPFNGLQNAKAVIGVIPQGDNGSNAVFRYFAEIIAEDIHNVDACVLKITTRIEEDVESDALVGEQKEIPVEDSILEENLPAMKLTRRYELEEAVRILGFNQGGEGRLEKGKHVNRSADFAKGYICKQFKVQDDENSDSDDDSSSSGSGFSPREEIVIMCPTISGHSGGPCVNDEGRVIGILSRADPVDPQRCYLAPSNELKALVNKAKKNAARIGSGGLKMF